MTADMKVGLTCESVSISESYEKYAWLLNSMAEMEPRWTLQNIRLIFADGFLSKSLLVDLGIHNTCVLRGDYYHLMNINWPDESNFGKQCFPLIREHLKKCFSVIQKLNGILHIKMQDY